MLQDGKLKEEDVNKLKQMEVRDIAKLAAHQRGAKKDNGAATRAIRRWVVANKSVDELRDYDRDYRVAWSAEKLARENGESSRPADKDRLCVSSRPARRRPDVYDRDPVSSSLAAQPPKGSVYA